MNPHLLSFTSSPPSTKFSRSLQEVPGALTPEISAAGPPAPPYLVMRRGSMKLGESRRRLRMGE